MGQLPANSCDLVGATGLSNGVEANSRLAIIFMIYDAMYVGRFIQSCEPEPAIILIPSFGTENRVVVTENLFTEDRKSLKEGECPSKGKRNRTKK